MNRRWSLGGLEGERLAGSVESVERQGDDLKREAAPHCTYEPGGLKRLRAVRSVTAVTGGTVC